MAATARVRPVPPFADGLADLPGAQGARDMCEAVSRGWKSIRGLSDDGARAGAELG